MSERENPMPGQVMQTVSDLDVYEAVSDRFNTDNIDEAEVITSLMAGSENAEWPHARHKLIIDLDLPAKLIPSSTEGHYHLYIDKEMTHQAWVKLLEALSVAGIIEPGYMKASIDRGYTAVRLPWVKKNEDGRSLCIGCKKRAHQLPEYIRMAEDEGYESPFEAVRRNEGTFNRKNGHFWCTSCYIKAGMPLGVAP